MDVQARVRQAIGELVDSGAERGVQVAVYRRGELVVDAVAGVADPATGRPVTSDTVFYNFSIAKAAAAAVAHVLVERGAFAYDTRVAELWPEFGARGKEAVTVRHVLTHAAGVPGLPPGTTVEDLCDWDGMCAVIADSEPWWEPGTEVGYHAYTFGYLVGEIVRRATGRPISRALHEDVAGPLGVGDELYFGMPRSEHGRLAVLEDGEGAEVDVAAMPADPPMLRAVPPALFPTAALGNRADVLAADIPAGGKTSARAMARVYAGLLGGELIPPERLRAVTAVAASGEDRVFGNDSSWGLGFAIGLPGTDPADTASVFGMAGAGGSYAFGDTGTGIACAVTKNRLTNDFTTVDRVIEAIRG